MCQILPHLCFGGLLSLGNICLRGLKLTKLSCVARRASQKPCELWPRSNLCKQVCLCRVVQHLCVASNERHLVLAHLLEHACLTMAEHANAFAIDGKLDIVWLSRTALCKNFGCHNGVVRIQPQYVRGTESVSLLFTAGLVFNAPMKACGPFSGKDFSRAEARSPRPS